MARVKVQNVGQQHLSTVVVHSTHDGEKYIGQHIITVGTFVRMQTHAHPVTHLVQRYISEFHSCFFVLYFGPLVLSSRAIFWTFSLVQLVQYFGPLLLSSFAIFWPSYLSSLCNILDLYSWLTLYIYLCFFNYLFIQIFKFCKFGWPSCQGLQRRAASRAHILRWIKRKKPRIRKVPFFGHALKP